MLPEVRGFDLEHIPGILGTGPNKVCREVGNKGRKQSDGFIRMTYEWTTSNIPA